MKIGVSQILVIGLVVFLMTAYTSLGYHHSDEHWQLLEFANFKLGRSPANTLASEYAKEMRSAFQPTIAFLSIKACENIGITNPFHIAMALRLVSCLLAWLALAAIVVTCEAFGMSVQHQKLLAIISMALWFIPYTACRFSNENWSGFLFSFGVLAIVVKKNNDWKYSLLSGVLIGLSYLCRFQIAFAVVGILAWMIFVKKVNFQHAVTFIVGIAMMMGVGALLDNWFYGHFTFTAYNYFYANIIEGVAASFGVSPWWHYFLMIFESAAAPLSILILAGYFFSLAYYRTNVIHMVTFFFLVGHCMIGHKELRFLFPMIYFVPLILLLSYQKIKEKWDFIFASRWAKIILLLIAFENSALLVVITFFKPAEETVLFNRFIYDLASKESVALFYKNHDPYQFGNQRQDFYFPKGLTVKRIENDSTLLVYRDSNPTQRILIFDDQFYPSEDVKAFIGVPVFKTFPLWITNFNIGNWLSRAKAWSVYEAKENP